MSELRFDGRVAIVTGAGRGLGRSHALALAARGASVVVNDLGAEMSGGGRDDSVARAVAEEIEADGGWALADAGDVSTREGGEALVAAAIEAFGGVDVVVNNAGILRWTGFPEASFEELDDHLAVHVRASFGVTRAAWPHLAEGGGNVVMTTSSAIFGGPEIASYSSAKAALIGLARSLATAGAPHGILVNALAPTSWSRMMESSGIRPDDPIARRMRPELVSAAVLYLAHPSCRASGEICVAGGGRIARIFTGETRGWTTAGDLTPEDVRDHWDEAVATAPFFVPTDNDSYPAEQEAFLSA